MAASLLAPYPYRRAEELEFTSTAAVTHCANNLQPVMLEALRKHESNTCLPS